MQDRLESLGDRELLCAKVFACRPKTYLDPLPFYTQKITSAVRLLTLHKPDILYFLTRRYARWNPTQERADRIEVGANKTERCTKSLKPPRA
jgi:hypothetical protein